MDADDGRLGGHGSKAGTHRFAARGASGHTALRRNNLGRDDDHDSIACSPGNGHGMIDDSPLSDHFELLGATEPGTGATGDHDGPHNLCCVERHDRRG